MRARTYPSAFSLCTGRSEWRHHPDDERRAGFRHPARRNRDGYDEIADAYLADRTRGGADVEALAELTRRLASGARVLDAGCGAGIPVARHLVDAGLAVVGLDLSGRQLELASELVAA